MSPPEAFFIEANQKRLFAVYFPPESEIKGAILYVPPFEEEANRCRYFAAQQARQFANNGYACLLVDPHGTGDSSGNLVEASWPSWREDVMNAASWLEEISGAGVTLWGMRLGALLAADVCNADSVRFKKLIFWQPVIDGKIYLTQFLRQRVASLLERNEPPETTADMFKKLEEGEIIEVSGYELSWGLVDGIINTRLKLMENLSKVDIDWIEVVASVNKDISMGSRQFIDNLQGKNGGINVEAVVSPPLWTLHKRITNTSLIEATTHLVCGVQ